MANTGIITSLNICTFLRSHIKETGNNLAYALDKYKERELETAPLFIYFVYECRIRGTTEKKVGVVNIPYLGLVDTRINSRLDNELRTAISEWLHPMNLRISYITSDSWTYDRMRYKLILML